MTKEELITTIAKELLLAMIEKNLSALQLGVGAGDSSTKELGKRFDLIANSVSETLKKLNV